MMTLCVVFDLDSVCESLGGSAALDNNMLLSIL